MPRRRPARDPRTYYHRDRLLFHLQHLCPIALAHFPDPSRLESRIATSDDGLRQYWALEIGRVVPMAPTQEVDDAGRLLVIDRGAFDSNAPELVPYTFEGGIQRLILEANGFMPTGIFHNFRPSDEHHTQNARLDDPLVASLVQFIFILRDRRRYYSYSAPHDASPRTHLAPLIRALEITSRSSLDARPPLSRLFSTARPAWQHPRALIDPRIDQRIAMRASSMTSPDRPTPHNLPDRTIAHNLPCRTYHQNLPCRAAPHNLPDLSTPHGIPDRRNAHDASTNEYRANRVTTNGDEHVTAAGKAWPSGYNRFHLAAAHATLSEGTTVTFTETIIEEHSPDRTDQTTLDEATPGRTANSSDVSPTNSHDDSSSEESDY